MNHGNWGVGGHGRSAHFGKLTLEGAWCQAVDRAMERRSLGTLSSCSPGIKVDCDQGSKGGQQPGSRWPLVKVGIQDPSSVATSDTWGSRSLMDLPYPGSNVHQTSWIPGDRAIIDTPVPSVIG